MSTVSELFAPGFMDGTIISEEEQQRMAKEIGADSLRYLPVDALADCVGLPESSLCQACVTGTYPTQAGTLLYQKALAQASGSSCHTEGSANGRRIYG